MRHTSDVKSGHKSCHKQRAHQALETEHFRSSAELSEDDLQRRSKAELLTPQELSILWAGQLHKAHRRPRCSQQIIELTCRSVQHVSLLPNLCLQTLDACCSSPAQ